MKHRILGVSILTLMAAFAAPTRSLTSRAWEPLPAPDDKPTPQESRIEQRDQRRNGIIVGDPKVYDDALLQQMLAAAEAKLASMSLLSSDEVAKRLGAVTGADQRISSLGVSVQGPSLPSIQTTSKGPTETGKDTSKVTIGADGRVSTDNTVETSRTIGTTDTVTTRGQANPPTVTAPGATSSLPSSGYSVSASDILNEQMQLTYEIAIYRLLLTPSLSDYYVRTDPSSSIQNPVKLKTSLGFPITIIPDRRHKDAIAIVEVEVEKLADLGRGEPPAITALLPREKTYNVASITDKSTSLQGGLVTQVVGIGGSWLRGHKTYYVVQDQDTLALNFQPEDQNRVGFMWQFRPVLGREYVKSGLKQTFVQLAFPAPLDAREGEIGRLRIRTYWRKYDRKKSVVGPIIPNSLKEDIRPFDIPRYPLLARSVILNDSYLEDIGNGQILVRIEGRFLPGTIVRIGAATPVIKLDYSGIRFTAAASDLAARKVALVAHDGTEVPLEIEHRATPAQLMPPPQITHHQVTTVDETNSMVTVTLANRAHITEDRPPLLMVIGGRAFGYSDARIQRNEADRTLSAVVPTAFLIANPEVIVKPLFAPHGYEARQKLSRLDFTSRTEKLIVLQQSDKSTMFLLLGNRLRGAKVLVPPLTPGYIGRAEDGETLRTVTLTAAQIKEHKYLVVQRLNERPFLVEIPALEAKAPKAPEAKERVTVDADEAVIEGEGMKELQSVKFNDAMIGFSVAKNGNSVTLKGLRALGVTATARTQPIELEFKDRKATVKLEIVTSKVETVSK